MAQLHSAMRHVNLNTAAGYETAIGELVGAIGHLMSLPADTQAIRLGLGRLLQEAEWRWAQTQPPSVAPAKNHPQD
jgi:hypothetical protein